MAQVRSNIEAENYGTAQQVLDSCAKTSFQSDSVLFYKGLLALKKNNLPVGPPDEYKVSLSQVQRELLTAGFSIDKIDQAALDYQYIILAEKPLKPQKNSTQ